MAGKRYSRQRELIYEAVRGSKEHPTAEMVYQWLKPDNPNLSLGTVYRNLNLLSQEGLLRRMPFSVERYDAHTTPHCHLVCEGCGRVYDLELEYDQAADEAAAAELGAEILRHETIFYGQCAHCWKDKEEKK